MCLFWMMVAGIVAFVAYCGWLAVAIVSCLWTAYKHSPRKRL